MWKKYFLQILLWCMLSPTFKDVERWVFLNVILIPGCLTLCVILRYFFLKYISVWLLFIYSIFMILILFSFLKISFQTGHFIFNGEKYLIQPQKKRTNEKPALNSQLPHLIFNEIKHVRKENHSHCGLNGNFYF